MQSVLMMLRWLIVPTGRLIGLLALLIGVIRSQPPPALPAPLRGDCAASCWFGIEPGITASSQARDRLRTLGSFQLPPECLGAQFATCTTLHGYRSDPPTAIELGVAQQRITEITQYRPGFGLDAILAALGQPNSVLYQVHYDTKPVTFMLWFGYNQPRLGVSVTVRCPVSYRFVMHTGVDWVALYTPDYVLPALTLDQAEIRRALRRECSQFR